MFVRLLLLLCLLSFQYASADDRPNILLIVADDLGYADLGYAGSRIRTPTIDELAAGGLVFSRFHTAPMCAPTRAMLFTGNNNHVAGVGRQSPGEQMQTHMPGYEGALSDRVVPFPQLLQQAGYHTYIAGKWHLGLDEDQSPKQAGFDRSFVLARGAGNHWNEVGFREAGSIYREDGERVEYPDGQYSTTVHTNKLLGYIESNRKDGKPFFAAATYTTPHWPLQVPDDELDLYAGAFEEGYDRLWEDNMANLKARGFVDAEARSPERADAFTPWVDLSAEERRIESRKMELYAAMVDNLDRHVAELIAYLCKHDLYDNTLIIFMGDNGAASADFYNRGPYKDFIREHYDNSYDNMGKPDSWVSYGVAWAEASAASFKGRKWRTEQGGLLAPMFMTGPMVQKMGMTADYVTVMDLAPTLLEIAGAEYPENEGIMPMLGESMLALLEGDTERVHAEDYETVLFHRGLAMARIGDWKIVTEDMPFSEDLFRLYNVQQDPGESRDLRAENPEKFDELLQIWRSKRSEYGVILPSDL